MQKNNLVASEKTKDTRDGPSRHSEEGPISSPSLMLERLQAHHLPLSMQQCKWSSLLGLGMPRLASGLCSCKQAQCVAVHRIQRQLLELSPFSMQAQRMLLCEGDLIPCIKKKKIRFFRKLGECPKVAEI